MFAPRQKDHGNDTDQQCMDMDAFEDIVRDRVKDARVRLHQTILAFACHGSARASV